VGKPVSFPPLDDTHNAALIVTVWIGGRRVPLSYQHLLSGGFAGAGFDISVITVMSHPLPAVVQILSALASVTRCRIVASLRDTERSVSSLVKILQLRPSDISNHLAVLRAAGIVSTTRHGRCVLYRLTDRCAPLFQTMWDRLELGSDTTLAADAWRAAGGS